MTLPALPDVVAMVATDEALTMEAARIAVARGSTPELSAIAAIDATAREGMLRWLIDQVATARQTIEMVSGPYDGSAEWCDDLRGELAPVLADLEHMQSRAPHSADDATIYELAGESALAHPSTAGDALRRMRDVWWLAAMAEHQESRKRPGAWLAQFGIVMKHRDEIAAAVDARAQADKVATDAPPPAAAPQGTRRGHPGRDAPLPGQGGLPTFEEVAQALNWMREARVEDKTVAEALGVTRSTWHNWCAGRSTPRPSVEQARWLRAECARIMGDLANAEKIFADIAAHGGLAS